MKILDIGQCGFDGPRMKTLLQNRLQATVEMADTAEEAKEQLAAGEFDIVLVNRVLAADRSSGLELIEELVKSGIRIPIMLVSDYPEAQDAAVAAGAVRGFGKKVMGEPATLELIGRTAGKKG